MIEKATENVLVEARGQGEVWLTINRIEKHNALAAGVLADVAAAVTRVTADAATRFVVLRGAGERFFAAGGDLRELAAVRTAAETIAMCEASRAALDAIRLAPVPVIAYLNGDALGGGGELAVACDMRLFAPHARIGFIQARLSITAAWGGGTDLCQLIGGPRAMRMMARAEMVGAELALQWGLADAVVEGGLEGEGARAFLKPLLGHSPLVLRGIKAQTAAWRSGRPYEDRRALERNHLVAAWLHADHWAAVDRFIAKEKS